MDYLESLAQTFPLMRGGGAFLVAIGLGILIGAFGSQRWRLVWFTIGVYAAVGVMAAGGISRLIFAGLPYPAVWQWVVLGVAFAVEAVLVVIVVRRIGDKSSREFWLWILFVVGAHFLILGFSHGPICAMLAVACMMNAVIGLRAKNTDLRIFWAVDGALKIAGGTAMMLLSYA